MNLILVKIEGLDNQDPRAYKPGLKGTAGSCFISNSRVSRLNVSASALKNDTTSSEEAKDHRAAERLRPTAHEKYVAGVI